MALRQLYSKGIIHMDIKPDNILISTDGVLKVVDLGLANIDGGMVGTGGGTDGYVPPEADEQGVNTFKRDVFALGMALAAMVFPDRMRHWCSRDLNDFLAGCVKEDMHERSSVDQLERVSHCTRLSVGQFGEILTCLFQHPLVRHHIVDSCHKSRSMLRNVLASAERIGLFPSQTVTNIDGRAPDHPLPPPIN